MRPTSHMFHPAQSFWPALNLSLRTGATLVIPDHFAESGQGAASLLGARRLNASVRVTVIPVGRATCLKNSVMVDGEPQVLRGSLAALARNAWLAACEAPPAAARTPSHRVLLYNRSPDSPGNVRTIANMVDVASALPEGADSWAMEPGHSFCDQIRQLHASYAAVLTVHGQHMLPLVVLTPGALVIEVMHRTLHADMFCVPLMGAGLEPVRLQQGNGTYEVARCPRDFSGRYEEYDCAPRGACVLDNQKHQLSMGGVIYLSAQEVTLIVQLIHSR